MASGGALTRTVSGAARSGTGPARNRSTLATARSNRLAGTERIGRDRADADDGEYERKHQPEGRDGEEAAMGSLAAGRAGHAGRLTCDW